MRPSRGRTRVVIQNGPVLLHAREPQVLDSLPTSHPLHGCDIRSLSDAVLADGAARAILPSFGPLWGSLCSSGRASDEVGNLASSTLRRVVRVLMQRIRIEQLLPGSGAGAPGLDVSDEVLDCVTLAFVHMAGAFDAVAIINGLLAGLTDYRDMGWQKKVFRQKLRPTNPAAADLMEPSADGGRLLRAVLDFRNTIHRRMPDPATIGREGGDPQLRQMALLLDRRSHEEIFDAFAAKGWLNFVGMRQHGDHLWLQPTTTMSLMLTDGIYILNSLLALTPRDPGSDIEPDPDKSLYPTQLRRYAVEYLHLSHLQLPTHDGQPARP